MTKTIEARQAAQWLSAGEAVLVDVRSPDEFKGEHIACAMSVPLDAVTGVFSSPQAGIGRKVIFQCQKGLRGEKACVLTGDAAGREVYNLDGGIEGWKAAGLPVVGSGDGAPSLFRQVQIGVGLFVLLAVLAGFSGWRPGFALAGFFGGMLIFAGVTGWCGLALLLSRMPWNRSGPSAA